MELLFAIKLIGSRLYQYDTDRAVLVTPKDGDAIAKVQFANEGDIEAITMEHKQQEDGMVIAKIPNRLLVSGRNIVAYVTIKSENGERTRYDHLFTVKQRSKPLGYVLPDDENEILNYETLEKRIEELEKNGGGSGGSGEPGADGFSPIANVEQTAEGAEITITDKSGTTKATVKHGKDGKDGLPGADGEDGYTPQKGKDYFDGADGKTAYQYAQDGGYTGTEEEFAQKLASETNKHLILEDTNVPGKQYKLAVTGGKLTMEEVINK